MSNWSFIVLSRITINLHLSALLFCLLFPLADAEAAPISSLDGSNIVQQVVFSSDLFYFPYSEGLDTTSSISAATNFNESSWLLTVTGTYFGTPVAYDYVGDSSTFDTNGTISWTGSGTYGTNNLSLSGTAVFDQVDAVNIIISWSSDWMMSGNTVHQAENVSTIAGTSATVGTQTTTSLYSLSGGVTFDSTNFFVPNWDYLTIYENSEYSTTVDFSPVDHNVHVNVVSVATCNTPCTGGSQAQFVPEPGTLSLLMFGFMLSFVARKGQRKLANFISERNGTCEFA